MNFSLTTCLLVMPTCLILLGQTMEAAHIKDNYLDSLQSAAAAAEETADEILSVPEHGEDIESATGLVEGPPNPEDALDSEEEMSSMDLEDFLSQFVLIKTPYGYILAKAPTSGEMVRVRRGRQQAEKNFQLRVRKADRHPYNSNFQLRVRKSGQTQPLTSNLSNMAINTAGINNGRVRKAILQEIRDRRRMAADHSNNNFQLRVRKSQERSTRGGSAGRNFQLRVKRSAGW